MILKPKTLQVTDTLPGLAPCMVSSITSDLCFVRTHLFSRMLVKMFGGPMNLDKLPERLYFALQFLTHHTTYR